MNKIHEYNIYFVPFVTFLVGIVGSVHCVAMCGGLVAASTKNLKENLSYQIARLTGYLIVSGLIYFFGKVLILNNIKEFSFLADISISLVFFIFGTKLLFMKDKKIRPPKFLSSFSERYMANAFKIKSGYLRSSFVGLFSVLLPCGYLYTVLLSLIALNNYTIGTISIISFWLGTLPALLFGVNIFRSYFENFLRKKTLITAFVFIFLGFATLGTRYYKLNFSEMNGKQHHCH